MIRMPRLRLIVVWLGGEISNLDPAAFALVMATGIISNGLYLQGHREVSNVLFAVSLLTYPWLWLLTVARAVRFRTALWTDLTNPARIFSFFTIVAATDVLGSGVGFRFFPVIAVSMWLVALAIWLVMIYFAFAVLLFRNRGGSAKLMDGAWLNGIVGTQSLVILGVQAALPKAGDPSAAALLLYTLWAIGCALYGMLAVLLCYRLFFFEQRAAEVSPILWVLMGAAAISTNAGSNLSDGFATGGTPGFRLMQPLIDGVCLALWSWATWTIPLLILLGIWKHGVRRVPIAYTPLMWSIVFPLGMYAVATLRLAPVVEVAFLRSLSEIVIWIALAAWAATIAGFVAATWHAGRLVSPKSAPHSRSWVGGEES
jgi:tellurite resistance protein TehA-like permease